MTHTEGTPSQESVNQRKVGWVNLTIVALAMGAVVVLGMNGHAEAATAAGLIGTAAVTGVSSSKRG
ncbi:hypothetical protein [Streptomyces parvus]|uniref:hypothetical protein n=1 Tax=Streptomyces parvus TaxID=66428 RepID=UPI002100C8AB|nr:hypothetical protein [Streptomyces parvus]MCQ1582563.1 hypothetical protein [Streptomyces parvus]